MKKNENGFFWGVLAAAAAFALAGAMALTRSFKNTAHDGDSGDPPAPPQPSPGRRPTVRAGGKS